MASKKAANKIDVGQAVLPIALVFDYDRRGGASILQEIGRYASVRGNWALVSIFPHRRLAEALASLKPAGIIVNAVYPGIAEVLRKVGRPVVSTSLTLTAPQFHQVARDEASIGSVAAKHLIECGLRNFGYFGPPWDGPTANREGGFRHSLQNLSHTVSVCYVRPPGSNPRGGTFASQKDVSRWVRQLPKPAGVFAPSDMWALWLSVVCKQEGINVPGDVAIIGAENDELMCEMSQPSLSSIAIPFERIGYEAAAMLDRLINRKPVPDKSILLPATSVVIRQSTNILAGVEPSISAAIHYIREHISEPLKVEDVLQHVRLPRRSFEMKFHAAMGHSPAQEIRRMRVEMAKTLLTNNPQIKTDSIARLCGFSFTAQFFKVFHQATGMTPADYRRTMGPENGGRNR